MPKKETLDGRGYSLCPQDVSKQFWYYEGKDGLQCIYQPRDRDGNLLFAAPAWTIPWRLIEKSMERRMAAKRKAGRKRRAVG